VSWKTFKLLCRKFIQDNAYQILPELAGFCGRYDKNISVFFSLDSVHWGYDPLIDWQARVWVIIRELIQSVVVVLCMTGYST